MCTTHPSTPTSCGKPLRLWVAITAATGLAATALVPPCLLLDSGHARAVFIWGLLATAAAGRRRRADAARAAQRRRSGYAPWRRAARPRPHSSADRSAAGPAHRHHRQPAFTSPRRLRALSAHRAALLPATHQTPHRRGRTPPQPWRANCPPAHGSTGSPYPKISANCCAPCCTGTATSPPGYRPASSCSRPPRRRPTPAPASTG